MPALGRCVPHLASVTWFWLAAGLPAQEIMPTEVLRGRVVTPEGRPVANAAFEVRRRAISFTCLDLDFLRATRVVRRARTAKDGTFAVHLPLGLACELHLDVAPYARVRLDPVFCGDDLRIALQPAATLEGQVRVQGIGRPCAGARVDVFDPNGYGNRVRTTTDARGAFRIARLSPARYTVRVAPVDATQTFQLVGLRAGQTVRVELESEPGKLLAGVLTDADSGRPVAGAEIGEGWAYSKTVSTDARGRFAMHGFGSRGYVGVYFRAPGYASSQLRHPRDPRMAVPIGEQRHPPLPLDTRDLHLELRRGHRLVGRVLRPDG
jgi:hypothetical protein